MRIALSTYSVSGIRDMFDVLFFKHIFMPVKGVSELLKDRIGISLARAGIVVKAVKAEKATRAADRNCFIILFSDGVDTGGPMPSKPARAGVGENWRSI